MEDGTEYTTDITITITGADDPFAFTQPDGYSFSVAETLALDSVVGQVQASDFDADPQAPVTYDITAGDDNDVFEVNADRQIILKKGLDYETLPLLDKTYTLTVTATDGTNNAETTITVNVGNVDEGSAEITITSNAADPDAYDVGVTLTATLVAEDPDGLKGTAEWRWFYVDAPFTSIGSGTTYTISESDRGEQIGVARVYQDQAGDKPIFENEVREVFGLVVPRAEVNPETGTESNDNTIAVQADVASKVSAGDGSDTISDGNRNDVIIGGLGDDTIDLGHDADGNDRDQVIYRIGDQTGTDGGDTITNFNRGHDSFVFELANNAETSDISDMDSFLSYLNGGTASDLSDDQLLVGLNFDVDTSGNVGLNGLTLQFEDSVFFSGGRISIPVVMINFADPLDRDQIVEALGGEEAAIANIVNSDGILTDLSYLDDLLGGPDAIGYQIEVI